jgi:hypothetical protein
MEIVLIIALTLIAIIGLFDVLPYCLAAVILGQYPHASLHTWQFLKWVFRRKPRYPTWNDIPNDKPRG